MTRDVETGPRYHLPTHHHVEQRSEDNSAREQFTGSSRHSGETPMQECTLETDAVCGRTSYANQRSKPKRTTSTICGLALSASHRIPRASSFAARSSRTPTAASLTESDPMANTTARLVRQCQADWTPLWRGVSCSRGSFMRHLWQRLRPATPSWFAKHCRECEIASTSLASPGFPRPRPYQRASAHRISAPHQHTYGCGDWYAHVRAIWRVEFASDL